MSAYHSGRHEFGQNFLTDNQVLSQISSLVAVTKGPIVEIGPGEGAITRYLVKTGRDLTAVEIDPRLVGKLRKKFPDPQVTIIQGDFLKFHLPHSPHVIVGNIPFDITTAILRHLLRAPGWTDAILVMQWEVARRRAGVGSSTMMTAQWAPWFEFSLEGRVPARAFTPRPNVDGGILTMRRRSKPLLEARERKRFQHVVHGIYTGKGRGIAEILFKQKIFASRREAQTWLNEIGVRASALPSGLTVEHWVALYSLTRSSRGS
ncbi:23S ribosomal RNA methyltransferase Erm [Corynebacterium sp. S7]